MFVICGTIYSCLLKDVIPTDSYKEHTYNKVLEKAILNAESIATTAVNALNYNIDNVKSIHIDDMTSIYAPDYYKYKVDHLASYYDIGSTFYDNMEVSASVTVIFTISQY